MTYLAIVQEVLGRLGITSDSALQAQVAGWVNYAQDDLESRANWPFLEKTSSSLTTTSGTAAYSLVTITDLRKIRKVRVDDQLLDQTTKEEVEQAYPSQAVPNGQPAHWYLWAGQLVLVPTPSSTGLVIKIDYYKTLADLDTATYTTTGSPTDIPATYHEALVLGAFYLALQAQEDWGEADKIAARYEAIIARMLDDLMTKGADERLILGSAGTRYRPGRPVLDPSRFPPAQ